jgi:hypothetical protein
MSVSDLIRNVTSPVPRKEGDCIAPPLNRRNSPHPPDGQSEHALVVPSCYLVSGWASLPGEAMFAPNLGKQVHISGQNTRNPFKGAAM